VKLISRIVATVFFAGYSPFAPGTVGSAVGLAVYWAVPGFSGLMLALSCALLFFIGVWAATEVEKSEGHDPPRIVVDEVVGMWVTLYFAPSDRYWLWMIGAFLLFRIFDILKPFPVGRSQRLPAGWGVMVDDVLAGLYAGFFLRLLIWFFQGS